jgi:pimeloyl-ACP methyl ester carboxylesterase
MLGHSYGGILIRELVARNLKDIKGLRLVDANTERTHADLKAPWDDIFTIGAGLLYLL